MTVVSLDEYRDKKDEMTTEEAVSIFYGDYL
jgi:hypothetical protein